MSDVTVIADIASSSIEVAKNNFLWKHKIKVRRENKAEVSDFENPVPVSFDEETFHFKGGLFSVPFPENFLFDILLEKFDADLSNLEECFSLLDSKRGLKIQRARFRDVYIKPVNKWMRNRGVADRELALHLVSYKVMGGFDDLATHLDETKTYSLVEIGKYLLLKRLL